MNLRDGTSRRSHPCSLSLSLSREGQLDGGRQAEILPCHTSTANTTQLKACDVINTDAEDARYVVAKLARRAI